MPHGSNYTIVTYRHHPKGILEGLYPKTRIAFGDDLEKLLLILSFIK
jgi:hypothetical protein